MAQAAQAAGASGLLLFPPYLTEASQQGLVEHISAVCRATDLGVIDVTEQGLVLVELASEVSEEEIREKTEPELVSGR